MHKKNNKKLANENQTIYQIMRLKVLNVHFLVMMLLRLTVFFTYNCSSYVVLMTICFIDNVVVHRSCLLIVQTTPPPYVFQVRCPVFICLQCFNLVFFVLFIDFLCFVDKLFVFYDPFLYVLCIKFQCLQLNCGLGTFNYY